MIENKQLWRGWIVPGLCVLMLVLGMYFEKKLNEMWLNCHVLEGRSRGIVFLIELSKNVFDTGDKNLMKRFIEDAYAKRNQLSKGANDEEFIYFLAEWENDITTTVKNVGAK